MDVVEPTTQEHPTGAVLLTDPPSTVAAAATPAPEKAPPAPVQEDEDTVAFGVLAVMLLLTPVVAVLGQRLAWDSVGVWVLRAVLVAVCGLGLYLAWRLEPKAPRAPVSDVPTEPVREVVALPRPAEPQRQVLELASRCRVCGRTLTLRADQEVGVDNACYVRHGSRRVYADNPAHRRWLSECHELRQREEQEQADADRRYRQALAEWHEAYGDRAVQHRREQTQWLDETRAHDAFLASAEGLSRVRRARAWRTASAGALGLLALALL